MTEMTQTKKILVREKDLDKSDLSIFEKAKTISVDCEMMGLNINRDRLCVVQVSDNELNIRLIRIEQGQKVAENLKTLLENEGILKLFHFARTDVSWLDFWLDIQVSPVFCTKIASKLARTYTDKHGLKDLTKEVLGKDISKAQQSSYWGNTELNKDQIKYAAADVENLISLYEKLKFMLEREGRLELALKSMDFISLLSKIDNLGYKEVFEH